MNTNEYRKMHRGLDVEVVCVRERYSDWVGPMADGFQLEVLRFPAEGRIVNSD